MKQILCAVSALCLLVWLPMVKSQVQPRPKVPREKLDPQKVKALMHRKLDNSQKILSALTLNDLDKAAQHAEELITVSKEAAWVVFKTRDYENFSDDFRHSAETLVKHAKDKNLEGAKLKYLEMTLNCFHCHAYVRDVSVVRFDSANLGQ